MAACHPGTVGGDSVYAWGYYPWSVYPSQVESVGHAAYDMVGVYRAFNRSSYGFTLSKVQPFANALVDVMSQGGNNFSASVDGSGGTQNYMQAQWLLLGDWNSSVYDLVAAADLASGRYQNTTLMDATILWMKQRRYLSTNTWEIQNVTSSKVLNQAGSTTNGSPITQWTAGTSVNLKFTLIPMTYGFYQINSVKSGKDVVVQSASTANGALLIQWSLGSSGDDLWRPAQNSDATWSFYNLNSGKVINNTGGSLTNNSQYSQWSWANSSNEKFNLLPQ
jgi:Ricin-type beta-trefoil lectin domain-like